jgi:hypothetical protein
MQEKKFFWESQNEYEYRNETGRIAADISKVLHLMETIAVSGKFDYSEVKTIIDKGHKKVKYMVSPSMYDDAHKYLQAAVQAYARAMEILVPASKTKDAKGTYKAGRLIEEGNCFIKITKSRLWQSIEERIEKEKG